MPKVQVLIGAQWGDEGKGKWVDIFASKCDLVVRYQGGNNAGHTLYIDGKKVVLHQIPSGIFHKQPFCSLASGVVINPVQMMQEISTVSKLVEVTPEKLWLSARAHVITPWHITQDENREKNTRNPIGTTKRGIGPTYADKAARHGLRLGDYVDQQARQHWFTHMSDHFSEFADHLKEHADDWQQFEQAATEIAAFVCDAEVRIRKIIRDGRTVLLEGAQGALLDLDHGTYPYVTSSFTGAGGACQSIGLAPKSITSVLGVAKAYVTRVGEGPMPTELFDEVGKSIAEKGQEFGATTKRPRRCGWFDAVAMRHAVDSNGIDHLILNKMDILTGFETLKIATAYEHPTLGRLTDFPWDSKVLEQCKPVYETHKGWTETLPDHGHISDLPLQAREYVKAVEQAVGIPVSMVGTGPERHHAIECL